MALSRRRVRVRSPMTLPSQKYLLENLLYERSVWFPDKGRAPYLAGLSRDVGFRCSFPLTLDSSDALSGQHRWYPTSREKRARYGAPVLGLGISVSLCQTL